MQDLQKRGKLFIDEVYSHCLFIISQFPWKEITVLPVQWHVLSLGLFASIIAPFGGFFASGFKRAFKIKVCAVTNLIHEIIMYCRIIFLFILFNRISVIASRDMEE